MCLILIEVVRVIPVIIAIIGSFLRTGILLPILNRRITLLFKVMWGMCNLSSCSRPFLWGIIVRIIMIVIVIIKSSSRSSSSRRRI